MSDNMIRGKYIYVENVQNVENSVYDGILACPAADDWYIQNAGGATLSLNGVLDIPPEGGDPIRKAIVNANIGTLEIGNLGIFNIDGAILNRSSGDVIIGNSGELDWIAGDSSGIAGNGPALLNAGSNSSAVINNGDGGIFKVKGALLNQNGGELRIENDGIFEAVGSTVDLPGFNLGGLNIALGATDSADNLEAATDIRVANRATMNLTGMLYNDTRGGIYIVNSGDFTLTGARDGEGNIIGNAVSNQHDGDIVITNDIGANSLATLVLSGSIVNLGHGNVVISDFTSITGHVYGEHITLSGGGEIHGGVFGSITATDTGATVNAIRISGSNKINGVKLDPEDEYALALAGAAGNNTGDYRGAISIVIGGAPPEDQVQSRSAAALAMVDYVIIGGNAVLGGINTNVARSTSATIGTGVTIAGNIFGGGYSTIAAANVAGSSTININGSLTTTIVAGNIYGGGYAGALTAGLTADIGTSGANTSTDITVKNAKILGSIYGGGYGVNSHVYGSTTITLSGEVNFANLVTTSVIAPSVASDSGTVSGYKLMNFTDYASSSGVNAVVSGAFNEIAFRSNTRNLSFVPAQNWATVGQYTFDVSERSSTYSTTALVNLGNVTLNNSARLRVDLKFAGQSTDYTYKLAVGANLADWSGKTITVYDKNNGDSVILTIGGDAVQSSKNLNVYYRSRLINGNELWLDAYNTGSGVLLSWPKDYWDRYAPGMAPAVTASGTLYLGDGTTYQYTDPQAASLNSVKAAVTLADGGTVYGGASGSAASTLRNTWINIKSTGSAVTGGTVYGGGNNASSTLYSTNIYIYKDGAAARPVIKDVFGGGKAGTVSNGAYIDIAGADIKGNIYGGGDGGTVNGGTTVTFAGLGTELLFTGTVHGNGKTGAVNGDKKLVFGDFLVNGNVRAFTGNFDGNFDNFNSVKVNAGSDVTLRNGTGFKADSFDVAGRLDSNGKSINSNGAATVALLVESTGVSASQFIVSGSHLSVDNRGSLNGAKAVQKDLTVLNSGTITGNLSGGANIALNNQTAGLLSNATLSADVTPVSLSIINSSRKANQLTTTGTIDVRFGSADKVTWLNNTGILTLGNSGTLTVGAADHTGIVSNTAGDFTWSNAGTLTYYGQIRGNDPGVGNTGTGHIALRNTAGSSTFHGVYDPDYGRDVIVLSRNSNAGSSFSIDNAAGTMDFYGAVYALSTVQLNITNRGTMNFISTTDGTVNSNIRGTVNSFGPGGFLVENYGAMNVDAFRNECLAAGQNSGVARVNNYSGSLTTPSVLNINGRLFDGTEILPLAETADKDILLNQRVAISNIGANGVLYLNNQSNAVFNVRGVLFNADGSSLQVVNSGEMNLGYDYDTAAGATIFKDAMINNNTTSGINLVNTGALDINGSVRNIGGGNITLANNSATAVMSIYGANVHGVYSDAVVNDGSGNIFIDNINTASTAKLYIYGNIVNLKSGSVNVSNYTLIEGDAIGKNVNIFAGNDSTFKGTISGGEIQNGENTRVEVNGGKITESGEFIAGYSGAATAGNTSVTITGGATVAAKVVGGARNKGISGSATTALANSTFSNKIYGGGYADAGNGATVGGMVTLTLTASTTTAYVFGGGANADIGVAGNSGTKVTMTVTGGSYTHLFGGGEKTTGASADVYGDTLINVTGAVFSRIYGGGYHAAVQGNTTINVGNGTTAYTLAGSIFGGGYGNANVSGTAAIHFSAMVSVAKNVWSGGLADAGQSQEVHAARLTVTGSTVGGLLYGGGYANGGSTTVTMADIVLDSGNFNNWVVGGGYATGGSGIATVKSVNFDISGGTFNSTVRGGGYAAATGTAQVDSVNMVLSGGVFNGLVFGAGYSAGGSSRVGEVNMTVSGGSFHVGIVGGGGGSTAANSENASVLGNVSITLDTRSNVINFNQQSIYAGGNQRAAIRGSTLISLQGSAGNLQNLARIYGGSVTSGKVGGERRLKFDGFSGTLTASIYEVNKVTLTGDSAVTLGGGQDLTAVNQWDIVADDTSETPMLTWGTNCDNSFDQDHINLDISRILNESVGYTQTLMRGASVIFDDFSGAVTSIGYWNNGFWQTVSGWSVSVEALNDSSGDSIMKLSRIAVA